MESLVYLTKNGNKATTSRHVATGFERKHQHVLRLIDSVLVDITELFTAGQLDTDPKLLFHQTTYQDEAGNTQRSFIISESGFKLLAMRMTGKRALGFQLRFIQQFEQLQAQVVALQQQVAGQNAQQATQEVARLAVYTNVDKQIECVKGVAGALVGKSREGFGIINHHRAVMKLLTGDRPSVYVRRAVEEGLRVKGKSGRAVLRVRQPEKAATAAVLDDCVRQGKTLAEAKAAGLPDTLPAAFQTILTLGLGSGDLAADARQAA